MSTSQSSKYTSLECLLWHSLPQPLQIRENRPGEGDASRPLMHISIRQQSKHVLGSPKAESRYANVKVFTYTYLILFLTPYDKDGHHICTSTCMLILMLSIQAKHSRNRRVLPHSFSHTSTRRPSSMLTSSKMQLQLL